MLVKPVPPSLSDVSAVIFHGLIRTLAGWECTLPNQACLVKHRRRRGRGHGWLGRLDTQRSRDPEKERKRGRETSSTHLQTGRASGGICNLNANDLFQGGMSKGELTRSGSNAGTSRPPSASLHSQTSFAASSPPQLPHLSRVNCFGVESCWHFNVKHLLPSQP